MVLAGPRAVATNQGALAVRPDQVEWTPAQRAALEQLGIAEAPEGDQLVFLHVSQRMRLDPFNKEIYLIGRYDPALRRKRWTIQIGIDGFRSKSEEHPEFGGVDDAEYCGADGAWSDVWLSDDAPPVAARFTVYRKDWPRPVRAVAHYREYVQLKDGGEPTAMWKNRPAGQLAKCFDDQTEVLTEFGYRRFAEVGDARIMQVTGGGLEAVVARPFVQDYDGLMITLDSEQLNFSVTPNHNMVTTVGIVEARAMYATTRSQPTWRIPRFAPPATGPGLNLSDDAIRLSAAIMADGTRYNNAGWKIEVSRPAKISALDSLGMAYDRYVRGTKGDEATSRQSGRVIRSNIDKQGYRYSKEIVERLIDDNKHLRPSAIRLMNSKQARLLVDTLIEFDGTTNRTSGRRRFLTSDPSTAGAFELAATIAGYSVGPQRPRYSDLSDRPNLVITISDRDNSSFVRTGDGDRRKSLAMVPNTSGHVWCVAVPTGLIMVRRHGFAMVCGNCAEALARRRAFPRLLGGVYVQEELDHLDSPAPALTRVTIPELPAERAGNRAGEPDWDELICAAEHSKNRDELTKVWRRARTTRPNDAGLLNRIAAAGERIKAAHTQLPDVVGPIEMVDEPGPESGPPEQSALNRLFKLLVDGGVQGSDRALRLRLANRILNKPPAEQLTSFDQLTAMEVETMTEFLVRRKNAGDLIHTLADLGATPVDNAVHNTMDNPAGNTVDIPMGNTVSNTAE